MRVSRVAEQVADPVVLIARVEISQEFGACVFPAAGGTGRSWVATSVRVSSFVQRTRRMAAFGPAPARIA
ncbi:hypothetical protein GCM10010321_78780 [Streptomyces chartreusis]|nr:hypothetical protein GCM10010321_78780 [Streptomyces chartreusis]